MGPAGSHIKWPPRLKLIDVVGEVKEHSGRTIRRDNGHAISLKGEHYYVFGDTFCFDDAGEFVGVANNTIAHIPDISQPQISKFLTSDAKVPVLIPYTESEEAFNNAPKNKQDNRRIVLWNFSDVIEDSLDSGTGWIFFDRVQTHGADIEYEYGTGVARIEATSATNITVTRDTHGLVFGSLEPRFGGISSLLDDDGYVYLLGGAPKEWKTHLARIKYGSDFSQRGNYQFLTEDGWQDNYSTLEQLKNVLDDQMHGSIIKLKDDKFAPGGRPYMYFGVNKWLDNKMWVAVSDRIEGPWEKHFLGEIPKVLGEQSGNRYCLYPHPWASRLDDGGMMISWTDSGVMGGIVCLAMLNFEMERDEEKS